MRKATTLLMCLAIGVAADAAERINSKESLRLCKDAMQAELPEGTRYKFKRNSATSVESDRYKHWINVLEISAEEKTSKKLLCETSRSGEILVFTIKPGSWKI